MGGDAAAITLPAGPSAGLFVELGGAMFRRAVRVLGNEEDAARAAESLFVRFMVYADAQRLDDRARWNWIYRVVTSHALRQLSDEARPGGGTSLLPSMRSLRRLEEAAQNILVLAVLDALTVEEIAEVLGLPVKVVRQHLDSALATTPVATTTAAEPGTDPTTAIGGPGAHPSGLALDRDRAAHVAHVGSCARCRGLVDELDRLTLRFARDLAPGGVPRVAAAVRVERARRASGPRWRRILWLGGSLVLVAGLALLVARPRAPRRDAAPYAGLKGASRMKAAGIQISLGRGAELRTLAPGSALRPGDRLSFRVKAERQRYLELRVRRGDTERRLFPAEVAGGAAALVQPGQPLAVDYVVGESAPTEPPRQEPRPGVATSGQSGSGLWIIGRFADHPFPLDRPTAEADVEVVPVHIEIQPAAPAGTP